ncbi:MAG: four helix bundle protein, partial [Kofleriaceae bacterium]|nr:four helix bundle protein [Kofleriaceae bacterium]
SPSPPNHGTHDMLLAPPFVDEFLRALRPLCEVLYAQSPDLTDELRRAAASTVMNLVRGAHRTGRRRQRAYRNAAAKAERTKAALDIAVTWGWLEEPAVATARGLAERVADVADALAQWPPPWAFGRRPARNPGGWRRSRERAGQRDRA